MCLLDVSGPGRYLQLFGTGIFIEKFLWNPNYVGMAKVRFQPNRYHSKTYMQATFQLII